MADAMSERTVSDVMLRNPKTLPSDVSAAEVRAALEREGTYVVLLVDGSRFCGAVTEVPADADPGDRATRFVDASAPMALEDTPVSDALALLDEPHTEGQLRVHALDPELVWLAHEHEPWRPQSA